MRSSERFQSTHPVWGATSESVCVLDLSIISIHAPRVGCDGVIPGWMENRKYFNPRTPCGVRRADNWADAGRRCISIHAPRVGCDCSAARDSAHSGISIHAPRVGCDSKPFGDSLVKKNFNPRTPCGVRLQLFHIVQSCEEFQSTHPVWGATSAVGRKQNSTSFQSTHPVWGATLVFRQVRIIVCISIHAPRVGCDFPIHLPTSASKYFNPRTPCGVRLYA